MLNLEAISAEINWINIGYKLQDIAIHKTVTTNKYFQNYSSLV